MSATTSRTMKVLTKLAANLVKPTKQMKTGPGYQIDVVLHVEFIVKLYAQITHNVQRLNGVATN
jgi:hypothetical protein